MVPHEGQSANPEQYIFIRRIDAFRDLRIGEAMEKFATRELYVEDRDLKICG